MKKHFKPGDCVKCNTEDEYKAVKAVMLADGWPVFRWHDGYHGEFRYYGLDKDGEFMSVNASTNVIPLQDALFRGAPEWAIIATLNHKDRLVWLSHNKKGMENLVKFADSEELSRFTHEHGWYDAKVIATRSIKTPPQVLAETITEWPKCLGDCIDLSIKDKSLKFLAKWRGREFISDEINGVTEEQWQEAKMLSEQDMIRLSGRDLETKMREDLNSLGRVASAQLAEQLIDLGWIKKDCV